MIQQSAPAKINLGLHVLRKRLDGYHDIATVFLRIPWTERVTARLADDLSFTCTDPNLPADEQNLCLKAALRLAEVCGVARGAALHLDKRLPYGAGLGSGSSDAATTLRLLVDLWDLDVAEAQLHALAADLGADVPFFLGDATAYATGRGEQLAPLQDPATGASYRLPYPLVVVVPSVHVSTPEAYRLVTPHDEGRPDLRALVASNDLARWRAELVNDFEQPVTRAYPAVGEALEALRAAGAGYAALSGSGAAVFGVFEDAETARAAYEAARAAGHRAWWGTD